MGTLTIRNIDDEVIARLKDRARQNDRSLEAEIRAILRHEAQRPTGQERVALARRIAAMTPDDASQTDSTDIVRAARDRGYSETP